jgi:hypothetical protein
MNTRHRNRSLCSLLTHFRQAPRFRRATSAVSLRRVALTTGAISLSLLNRLILRSIA